MFVRACMWVYTWVVVERDQLWGGAPLRIMVGMVGVGRLGGLLISWGWGTLVHETVWGGVRGGDTV